MVSNFGKVKALIEDKDLLRLHEVLNLFDIRISEDQECTIENDGVCIINDDSYNIRIGKQAISLSICKDALKYRWTKYRTSPSESLNIYLKHEYMSNNEPKSVMSIIFNARFTQKDDGKSEFEFSDGFSEVIRFIKTNFVSLDYSDTNSKRFSKPVDQYDRVVWSQLMKIRRETYGFPKKGLLVAKEIFSSPIKDYVNSLKQSEKSIDASSKGTEINMTNKLKKLGTLIRDEAFNRVIEALSVFEISVTEDYDCDIKKHCPKTNRYDEKDWISIPSSEELVEGVDYNISFPSNEYCVEIINSSGLQFVFVTVREEDLLYKWSICPTNKNERVTVWGIGDFTSVALLNAEYDPNKKPSEFTIQNLCTGAQAAISKSYQSLTFQTAFDRIIPYSLEDCGEKLPRLLKSRKIKSGIPLLNRNELFDKTYKLLAPSISSLITPNQDVESTQEDSLVTPDDSYPETHGYSGYRNYRRLLLLRQPSGNKKNRL